MINVIRRSQIRGLLAIDGASGSALGALDEVWLDDGRQVRYLSSSSGYLPLEQVFTIGPDALLTYSKTLVDTPTSLHQLHKLAVQSTFGEPLGWVDDFLFDWETGDVVAYILGGEIATPFGGLAILYPQDVEKFLDQAIVIREDHKKHLKGESEGLAGFLSEKSQQVKSLVKTIGDRLHTIVSPHDKPEVVHVKIKEVKNQLAASGKHDQNALQEAAEFLQDQWENFQKSLSRAGNRAKSALDSAWHHLTVHK